MIRKQSLQTAEDVEPALHLLVRSMRTALGPADDDDLEEIEDSTQPPLHAVNPSVSVPPPIPSHAPGVGVLRQSTRHATGGATGAHRSGSSPGESGFRSVPQTSPSGTVVDPSRLTGVLRRSRRRTGELQGVSSDFGAVGRSSASVAVLDDMDSETWAAIEAEPDPEVEAFLRAEYSLQREGLVATSPAPEQEAPTPFAPDDYVDWSVQHSRGK